MTERLPATRRSLELGATLGWPALATVALHLASQLPLLVPMWRALPAVERTASLQIQTPLAWFLVRLVVVLTGVGALAGLVARLLIQGLGGRPTRWAITGLALVLELAACMRTVAHRPAMFEDLLWRAGGVRATFQRVLAEVVGPRVLDIALVALATCLVVGILFRLRARANLRIAAVGVLVAGMAFLAVHQRWPHPYRGAKPPLIILAADSLRPDHFSSEGYPQPTTPEIDRFRATATWFADEFVPIASTTASWTSLLTGDYPHHHGIRNLFPRDAQTRFHLPTLPMLLRGAGYASEVVSDYAGESFRRVDFGFDKVDAPPATGTEVFAEREIFQRSPLAIGLLSGSLGARIFPVVGYLPVNADPAALTERVEAALDELEDSGKPFFLLAFYSVTHAPFAAPLPEGREFADPTYAGPSRYSYELQQLSDLERTGLTPQASEAQQVNALYDGALRSFDASVGKLLQRFAEDDLLDRATIVITGDHGENLFEPGATTEHGKWFKGGEAANRTALIVRAPGVAPGDRNILLSGVDVAPTLLDALGIPAPSRIDGISVLRKDPPPDRAVFAESTLWLGGSTTAPPRTIPYPGVLKLLTEEPSGAVALARRYENITTTAKLRALRQGPWELVYQPTPTGTEWELFDLAHDPFGEHDVGASQPEVLAALRPKLIGFLEADPLRWLDAADHVVERVEQ